MWLIPALTVALLAWLGMSYVIIIVRSQKEFPQRTS
jgi:hypothetical protein